MTNSNWNPVLQWSVNAVTRAEISNLMVYTVYNVRVIVVYADMSRVPSAAEQVRTGVETPEDPPRNIEVKALDSNTLQFSWKVRKIVQRSAHQCVWHFTKTKAVASFCI